MSGQREIDRRIEAFFDQPTPELPDRAFDAVRRDIHGTRQRLVLGPWHIPDMPRFAPGLSVAAIALVIVGLWIVNLPSSGIGSVPTPSPSPTATYFRSPLYGYAIAVPDRWTATPAVVRWDGSSQPSQGPNVDQVSGPHLLVLGYAGPFRGDLAAFVQDRIAANARDHADTCSTDALQSNEPITIGGQPAVLLTLNCGAQIDLAITVHDGVGYGFTIRDLTFATSLDRTELATVRSMLDSLIYPTTPITSP